MGDLKFWIVDISLILDNFSDSTKQKIQVRHKYKITLVDEFVKACFYNKGRRTHKAHHLELKYEVKKMCRA